MFNLDVTDRVKVATKCFDRKQDDKSFKTLDKLVDNLNTRNKLISMADKSVAGWNTVDEYLTDELASDSDTVAHKGHSKIKIKVIKIKIIATAYINVYSKNYKFAEK